MLTKAREFILSLTQKHNYSESLKRFNRYERAIKTYVDYGGNLGALIDEQQKLVILRGMRGSGKSIAFLVATDRINRKGRGKKIALFFDCKDIADELIEVENLGHDLNNPDVLDTVIQFQIGKQFLLSLERLVKHSEKAGFEERFLRHINNKEFLKSLKAKIKRAQKNYEDVMKARRTITPSTRDVNIDDVKRAVWNGSDDEAVKKQPDNHHEVNEVEQHQQIRKEVKSTFADWYKAIAATNVGHVFLFFDEYSEPKKKHRIKIAEMIQKIVSGAIDVDVAKKSPDYKLRFAVYPAEQTLEGLFLRIGFGHKKRRYAEPYLKRLYGRKGTTSAGALDIEGGDFLRLVLKKSRKLHKISRINTIFRVPRGRTDIYFALLYSLGGGSIRRLMQIVSRAMHQPDAKLPLSISDIKKEGEAYWDSYLGQLGGTVPARDTEEFEDVGFISEYEKLRIREGHSFLKQEIAQYQDNKDSLLIKGRFLSVLSNDRKYILPLAERGVLYPINEYKKINAKEAAQIFSLCGSMYDEIDISLDLEDITKEQALSMARKFRAKVGSSFSSKYFDDEFYS